MMETPYFYLVTSKILISHSVDEFSRVNYVIHCNQSERTLKGLVELT